MATDNESIHKIVMAQGGAFIVGVPVSPELQAACDDGFDFLSPLSRLEYDADSGDITITNQKGQSYVEKRAPDGNFEKAQASLNSLSRSYRDRLPLDITELTMALAGLARKRVEVFVSGVDSVIDTVKARIVSYCTDELGLTLNPSLDHKTLSDVVILHKLVSSCVALVSFKRDTKEFIVSFPSEDAVDQLRTMLSLGNMLKGMPSFSQELSGERNIPALHEINQEGDAMSQEVAWHASKIFLHDIVNDEE